MADIKKKLAGNADGDFFVDSTCDNFDVCRQIAPETFIEWQTYAVIGRQPQTEMARRRVLRALVSCPKGAIGTADRGAIKEVFQDFPLLIEDDVYFCGFNTIKSAGANSYFIAHRHGNWLISTPKFHSGLVRNFEKLGGIAYIFLSHRDDLGEAEQYANHFAAKTIIHRIELDARPTAEIVLDTVCDEDFAPGFKFIFTPGHTEGHCMLLYRDKFLFSGDTLRYNRKTQQIESWEPLWTWYDYGVQAQSVARLADYSFEWILTSHGQSVKFDAAVMKEQISGAALLARQNPCPYPRTGQKLANLEYYAKELRRFGQAEFAEKIKARARDLQEELERAAVPID